jgi:hydrogenase maturation protease
VSERPKILIHGYGNPGREDDGLGCACIEILQKWMEEVKLDNVKLDCDYQLNVEDALTISENDITVFVDASIEDIDDYCLTKVTPEGSKIEFSMHAVSAAYILDLCNKLYNKEPEVYLLHIKGYEWDFKEAISPKAQDNLQAAAGFLKQRILDPASFLDHVVIIND